MMYNFLYRYILMDLLQEHHYIVVFDKSYQCIQLNKSKYLLQSKYHVHYTLMDLIGFYQLNNILVKI